MPPSAAASWATFQTEAPDIAAAGRRLLEDAPGVPGVAFLGTVAGDGSPRLHPFIPAVVGGSLWAFVIPSPKQRDLDRTGVCAIHSRLGMDDESFFCSGIALRVEDEDARLTVGAAMPYSDIDERHVLFELRLTRALWTAWATPTDPVHRVWRSRHS